MVAIPMNKLLVGVDHALFRGKDMVNAIYVIVLGNIGW